MRKCYVKKGLAVGVICLLMLVAIPVVNSDNEPEKSDGSWPKGIFFLCHVDITAEGDEVAGVGNAPPILVWSTEFGTVEITTPFRQKTFTGRTKGMLIHSAGPYDNNPFFINRDAWLCILW